MYEPILSVESIKQCDRECIEELGIAELALMENAGCAAYKSIKKNFGPIQDKHFLILCGKGNNGGDGLVIARKLIEDNAIVDLILINKREEHKGSTLKNLDRLNELIEQRPKSKIHIFKNHEQLDEFTNIGIIVDAIFGTGLNKDVEEPYLSLIKWINQQKKKDKQKKVIAVDIPSGINGNTGQIQGEAVKADLTATFAAKKLGLLLEDGQDYSGKIEVCNIGIPNEVLAKNSELYDSVTSVDELTIKSWFPKRNWKSYKYLNGMSFIIAGSVGLSGAAYLCSQAAALIGAGAVVCACPKSIQPVLAVKLTEVMTLPVDETERSTIALSSINAIEDRSKRASAILIGPGLGRCKETIDLVNKFILQEKKPMVIDADALYALSQSNILHSPDANLTNKILTPHWGEFKRLAAIEEDLTYFQRIIEARKYAQKWNCVILLKGFPSIIAFPSGKCFINQSGNPSISSAGNGDVLAGLCVGLLSQGLTNDQAALAAICIAGCAADEHTLNNNLHNMLATNVLETLPNILKRRFT